MQGHFGQPVNHGILLKPVIAAISEFAKISGQVVYLADKVVFITGVENDARKWHGELLLLCMVRRRQIENGHAEA